MNKNKVEITAEDFGLKENENIEEFCISSNYTSSFNLNRDIFFDAYGFLPLVRHHFDGYGYTQREKCHQYEDDAAFRKRLLGRVNE